MIFGSVCSGIEAASQAWNPLGWESAWFSEIEPFPCAVLAHHYPNTPNLGDMTKFESWSTDDKHAIDLLCGGTPCQSFSVAGLRKGLDDPRGDLMLTFGAIAAKYRPKWLVWENVPGVLSSNGGRDFASFLGLISGQVVEVPKDGWGSSGIVSGYKSAYGLAYRVLDSQYFGVAQRRRRVFVVGCLGDWRSAAAVLFERHSLSGDSAPRRGEREEVASTITAGAFAGGASGRPEGAAGNHFIPQGCGGDVAPTLNAAFGSKLGLDNQHIDSGAGLFVTGYTASSFANYQEGVGTIRANGGDLGGGSETLAVKSYGIPGNWIGRKPENGGNAVEPMHDVAPCQTKTDVHAVVAPIAYAFDSLSSNSRKSSNPVSGCNVVDVAKAIDTTRPDPSKNQGGNGILQPIAWSEELTPSVDCASTMQRGGQGGRREGVMTQAMQVRRLTPTECERLQGFPDGYTNVPHRGKPAADGPRYKALGNSWAVPCARWIGERIMMAEAL